MFRGCLEPQQKRHDPNDTSESNQSHRQSNPPRSSSISIGGGNRPRRINQQDEAVQTQARHSQGIHVMSRSTSHRESRSVSIDIKGPSMDVERIRLSLLDKSGYSSILDQSMNQPSSTRFQRNVNSLKRVVKPAVSGAYVPKRDSSILQNLDTRQSEESAIRWLEGRPPSIYHFSQKSPTPESLVEEPQWQRPYLMQPPYQHRRSNHHNNVLNTIESINCSEDSNYKSSIMVTEECMRDLFRPHVTPMESRIAEPVLLAPIKQTGIRMSESIIENTPTEYGPAMGGISAFRIFWSHSVEVPGQQYTAMDRLTGFLLNIKYLTIEDEQIANREISICKRLSYHPSILSHYHTFGNGSHFFVAQEYFEGSLESLFGRMTIRKVKMLAVGIIEAIESIHNDNVAHTQISARSIVVVRGVYKLTGFGWAVFNPSREQRYQDYNAFGRTLAVLAESMMLDSLLLKKEDAGDFMNLVYLLQQDECSIVDLRNHPFFNRSSLI